MTATADHVRALLSSGSLELALPGAGATAQRLRHLCDLARRAPIAVARLAEAHTDAIAILAEGGRPPHPGSLYGVWASQHPTTGVRYDPNSRCLDGTMAFASGLRIVDRALVSASSPAGTLLIDANTEQTATVAVDTEVWSTPALEDTATGTVTFSDHPVEANDIIGDPGWYLRREGFWQGACAPAACWAGGALGLVDAAAAYVDDDPHRRAHHGALLAHEWLLGAAITAAGDQIDAAPRSVNVAERVARSLRWTVASVCRDVLDRFGRAFGPRPYVRDPAVAQRAADLDLYIKQHHAERELPSISEIDAGR